MARDAGETSAPAGRVAGAVRLLSTDVAIVACTCFVLLCFHVAVMSGNYNDKACHRAMAYYCVSPHPEITESIRADMLEHWGYGNALSNPLARIEYCTAYPLPNVLTLALERLELRSAFQSVFLAHLLLHLGSVLLVFGLAGWVLPARRGVFFVGVLASLAPWLFVASWAFPFSNAFFGWHAWRTGYPRGAATLLCFAAAVFALVGQADRARLARAAVAALTCVGLALLLHRAMAAMHLATFALVALFPGLVGARGRLSEPAHLDVVLRRAALAAIAVTLGKLGVVIAFFHFAHEIPLAEIWASGGVRAFAALSTALGAFHFVATAWLCRVWVRSRADAREGQAGLVTIGDVVMRILLPLGVLSAALYPFAPTSHEWVDATAVLLYEPSRRLVAIPQIAWFTLLVLVVAVRWQDRPVWARTVPALVVAMAIGAATTAYRSFRPEDGGGSWLATVMDQDLLHVRLEDVRDLGDGGEGDFVLFHAVANEYRARARALAEVPGPRPGTH